jgi:methyl-accepting chemotaxis protein
MLSKRSIASKLVIAYGLFLAPIGYLGYNTIADNEAKIGFAAKEIAGVRYIAAVRGAQDRVARGAEMRPLVASIESNEQASGLTLNTADAAAALVKALEGTDRDAAAQASADLISKAADGSNLTLDPDLDSFYTQDALTVKVPTVVAGLSGLASTVKGAATRKLSVDDQVAIGVQVGALQPALDGLASDVASAVAGNPDKTVDGAVTPAIAKVTQTAKAVLADLTDHTKAADALVIARPLLDAVTAAGAADADEVEHLLNARIAGFRSSELISAGIALTLFLVAVGYVLIVLQRGTIGPLRALTATMRRLAEHDLSVDVGNADRGDEVGDMSRAVVVFKEQMFERQRLDSEAEAARALRERQHTAMERHIQDFGESMAGVLGSLGTSASTLHQTAQTMAASVEQTRSGTASTAIGAEQNSSRLADVAAATEELTSSVAEIARQVSHAAGVARSTVEQANTTGAAVQGLSEAVGQIGDVVQLISKIAAQTNLLALNATIEAARAGDAGKGFAVVASEVKELATQTRSATEHISSQIAAIQVAAENAVAAVRNVGDSILVMDEVTATIAAAVEEQGAATREISTNVQAVSMQNDDCARSINEVATGAERAKEAGEHVLSAGDDIGRVSEALKQEVADFFATLRADESNRRNWERIPGNRANISLVPKSGRKVQAQLIDISQGGASMECSALLVVGDEVEVQLPGVGGPVMGRVLRSLGTAPAIIFRQDPQSIARIDAVMKAFKADGRHTHPALAAAA